MAFDKKKDEITDEYLASQGTRAQLIKENILTWREMLGALKRRSAERCKRGDSMVKYDPIKGQGRVLYELMGVEGITQAGLSQRLGITPQTLGEHIKKLESAGLVARARDEADTRALRVSLTDKGVRAGRALQDEERYSGSMFEVFDEDELSQLKTLIAKLTMRLEEEYAAAKAYDALLGKDDAS